MWDDEQPSAQIAPQTPEQMAFFRKTMALFALGDEDEPFGSVPFDDSAFVQARTELAKRAAAVEPAEIDELFTEWKPLLLEHHRTVAGHLRERETKFSAKRRRRSKRWIFKSRRTGCRHLVQQIDAGKDVSSEEKLWRQPRTATKSVRPRDVPLSEPAVQLLESVRLLTGHLEHVFAGPTKRPISATSKLKARLDDNAASRAGASTTSVEP